LAAERVQPADIAITLRRRSPWEAMDLGLTMLQQWWRAVYAAHTFVFIPVIAAVIIACWLGEKLWLAMLLVWWLEPVYDRVVLHVLSRAVFGEVPGWRQIWPQRGQWLGTGLFWALTFDRFDLARSFNLPVRQLEGQQGRAARERKTVLGRRTRNYAVWLTVVWVHFEAIVMLSLAGMTQLLLPATAERARGEDDSMFAMFDILSSAGFADVLVYAAVILVLEPFYVAAGFALYLNRRTLLEGWDIEVALRRIAERYASAVMIVLAIAICAPSAAYAQQKDPKQEITEVLKAKEFGYHRDVERWLPKERSEEKKERKGREWWGIGYALARAAEVLLWIVAGGLIAYALWWAARMIPRGRAPLPEPYRPPAALFGMELAPEKLPTDVGAAAAALARQGKLREALALLYRGALSELVHKRGVQLLPSHTEGEAVRIAGVPYFAALVEAWRLCAYARRMPSGADVERLASEYKAAFA
jgi:hypothetical protein